MFGLFIKRNLIKAIKNACINEIGIYKSEVMDLLNEYCNDTDVPTSKLMHVKRNYFYAVFDAMWTTLRVSSPTVDARVRLALMAPTLTGLPAEFTVEYIGDNGISAGATFAICYYALSNQEINLFKEAKTLSMLNHFQNDLMNRALGEIEAGE